MFVTKDGQRCNSLNPHDKEFVTARKTCHYKDRLTSHVAAEIFAWAALTWRAIWANSLSVTVSPLLVFTLDWNCVTYWVEFVNM